jgi:hypothetical protein
MGKRNKVHQKKKEHKKDEAQEAVIDWFIWEIFLWQKNLELFVPNM